MGRKNKIVSTIILFVCTLIFGGCDSYQSRKNLVAKLSSLYNENQIEFNLIIEYFASDTIARFFTLKDRDDKIKIDLNKNIRILESIDQIKDNPNAYQILSFMERKKIQSIYGYGNGYIDIFFEDHELLCFNFIYLSDFNPEDETVKQEVKNIKDTKAKNWIYILDKKGWYIRGVKCF